MMLGFLLARIGVNVIVLEKHADFLRDFRGDTVHPSTLDVIYELGLLEDFLRRPHQEVRELAGQIGGHHFERVAHCPLGSGDQQDGECPGAGRAPPPRDHTERQRRGRSYEQGRQTQVEQHRIEDVLLLYYRPSRVAHHSATRAPY